SSRRRHTRFSRDWSSDVCSSDLGRWRRCWCWTMWTRQWRKASNFMLLAQGQVKTEKAQRYLKALCNHFSHKVQASYSDDRGNVRSEERRVAKEGRARGAAE